MTTFTLTLDAADVRHAQKFVSKEISRPLLQCVCIASTGVIVGTNGHVIMTILPEAHREAPPRDVVLKLPPIPRSANELQLTLNDDATRGPVVITWFRDGHRMGYLVAEEDANPYPNWRQVLPDPATLRPEASVSPFNAHYLSRFGHGSMGRVQLVAGKDAERGILVCCDEPRYIGVLMPLRMVEPDYWAKGLPPHVSNALTTLRATAPLPVAVAA